MTNYTVNAGHNGIEPYTTTANQVDTITFGSNIGRAQFISDGAAEVRLTIDGSTPAFMSAGSSTAALRMPAGIVSTLDVPLTGAPDVIKVVSAGAALVSVQVLV